MLPPDDVVTGQYSPVNGRSRGGCAQCHYQDHHRAVTSPGAHLDAVAAASAVVGQDVDIGAAAPAGLEAALKQVVARGTAAEQTGPTSPLLADSMFTHARHFTCGDGDGASKRLLSVRYITATLDGP